MKPTAREQCTSMASTKPAPPRLLVRPMVTKGPHQNSALAEGTKGARRHLEAPVSCSRLGSSKFQHVLPPNSTLLQIDCCCTNKHLTQVH
jgi:hypothetical protein